MDKPTTAKGYNAAHSSRVRATCLYIATKLGDLMDDLVIVGGLVPSLLIDQAALPQGAEPHVGTMDLDVGLSVALLNEERYRSLTERLRAAGFQPDTNEAGNRTRQRWAIHGEARVTVDFLIAPSREGDRGGKIRNIEPDFAALIAPGVHLAFVDRQEVRLEGQTIMGEQATRSVWVCGPGAYVVLKSIALRLRGENKDAYDLFYLIRNYGAGVEDVAAKLAPLAADPKTQEALRFLREDFEFQQSVGPRRAAEFVTGGSDDDVQAEVGAFVLRLLQVVEQLTASTDQGED